MFKLFRTCLLILFIISAATIAYSESTWISKKSDKSKKVEKVEKDEKTETSEWIKKKKVKENKKKFKEKIKESKSWITKKSKDQIKENKKTLRKHLDISDLPKADFYIAAIVESKNENEKPIYLYGYLNPDTKSEKFEFKNVNYFSKRNGFAYVDNKETTCEVDSYIGVTGINIKKIGGEVVISCKNKTYTAEFTQRDNSGHGFGISDEGHDVFFKYYSSKIEAVAQLENYKLKNEGVTRVVTKRENKKLEKLIPNGKYYALLIGNSKYDNWDDLKSPKYDVLEISKVLEEKYNFKVFKVLDASEKEIFQAIRNLSKLTTTKDYVLIYYSGHGQIKANQAYWIPKDGSKEWGNGDWVNIQELDIYFREIKAHHLAVMVDSCFVGSKFKGNNILDRLTDEDVLNIYEENLIIKLDLRARMVLSSGSTGQVSDTAAGTNHSRFALSLLNILNNVPIPISMRSVAINIDNAFAGTFQKPLLYYPDTWQHGGGDFIFIQKDK